MAKKITKEEFEKRFNEVSKGKKYEIVEYSAISNPCKIKCLKCGKVNYYKTGNAALSAKFCCQEKDIIKLDKIKERLANNNEYDFVKQVNDSYIIIRHNKCGTETKRHLLSAFKDPFVCTYCNTQKTKNMLPVEDVQKQLDDLFRGEIKLLEYNGQLKKNKYKCMKCGFIFNQKHICLLQSRGCPKCDKIKSKGEQAINKILTDNNLNFKEQVQFKDLPLQRFDFGVYNNDEELQYLIECQGEPHYKEVPVFRDSLSKVQERDQRKRDFCKKNNIKLYEIIYKKGKLLNLDILPF